jgi:AraC-like DNA-binding protein
MLESGARSVQEVARASGFNDPERMRRAFQRLFGASPAAMKRARLTPPAAAAAAPTHSAQRLSGNASRPA